MFLFLRKIIAFLVAFFTALFGFSAPFSPQMIGHRGFSSENPDNTELSFIRAAENGFFGCETDVRKTLDSVYVTNHDAEVTFYDETELEIETHTYKELTQKPLLNDENDETVYLCTFERYLEIMAENNMICFIELKGDFTEDEIKEIFNLCDEIYSLEKCILQSFEMENLLIARRLFPSLELMLTFGGDDDDSVFEKCFEYGISVDMNIDRLKEEYIEEFHKRGLSVAVYSANSALTLAYARSFDVDYIESNSYSSVQMPLRGFFDIDFLNPER